MKRIFCFGVIPLLFLAGHAQDRPAGRGEPEKASGYVVYERSPLSRLQGVDGELQLLQDGRLPMTSREKMWGQLAPGGDQWSRFRTNPARNAVLRIVERRGRIVEEKQFDQPLAELETIELYGDARISYLVTIDYSAGFGSYAGPTTSLAEVAGGKLKWLEALDKATGKLEPITLTKSLKTVWKLGDAPRGKARDIFEAACRPCFPFFPQTPGCGGDAGSTGFILIYSRYFFDGTNWIKLERREKGFSEFELGFPDRKLFP